MKLCILVIALLSSAVFTCAASRQMLVRENQNIRKQMQVEEGLYLPQAKAVELVSLGYRNALADILWFKTISYFGKHYSSDRDYRWLYHMCDLVTTLDPRAVHVYDFAALMLAWEAHDVPASNRMLTKAIENPALENHPKLWKFYYLRGFNYSFFLNDNPKATADFATGAKLPGAHVILARLAAKKLLSQADNPDSAIEFLEDMLKNTSDPTAQSALIDRLKDALIERDIRNLEKAIEVYRSRFGKAPQHIEQLQEAGILASLAQDARGGRYYLDSNSKVRSTSVDEEQSKRRK